MSQTQPLPDPRVRRTRQLILNTFLTLLDERDFREITVQEIVERAQINRTTFYRHYLDKYDLAEATIKANLEPLLAELAKSERIPLSAYQLPLDSPPPIFLRLFEHLVSDARFYQKTPGSERSTSFSVYIRTYIETVVRRHIQAITPDLPQYKVPLDVLTSFSSSALLGVISWWLDADMPYPPADMALWWFHLITRGTYYAFGVSDQG